MKENKYKMVYRHGAVWLDECNRVIDVIDETDPIIENGRTIYDVFYEAETETIYDIVDQPNDDTCILLRRCPEETYDVVLRERPADDPDLDGLSLADIHEMIGMMPVGEKVIPLTIEGNASTAQGFITVSAIYKLDDERELHEAVARILDDMELENPDHRYQMYIGKSPVTLSIYLDR